MPDAVIRSGTLMLEGDRGKRIHTGLTLEEHMAFGRIIAAWQAEHPGTIVRSQGNFSRSAGYGTIKVTWWPAGEVEQL